LAENLKMDRLKVIQHNKEMHINLQCFVVILNLFCLSTGSLDWMITISKYSSLEIPIPSKSITMHIS